MPCPYLCTHVNQWKRMYVSRERHMKAVSNESPNPNTLSHPPQGQSELVTCKTYTFEYCLCTIIYVAIFFGLTFLVNYFHILVPYQRNIENKAPNVQKC